jgi:hypothetical protein
MGGESSRVGVIVCFCMLSTFSGCNLKVLLLEIPSNYAVFVWNSQGLISNDL